MNAKEIEEYSSACDITRGMIITTGYKIELCISNFLTSYFAKSKTESDFFRFFMTDTLTFENKKYIFSSLRKSKKLIINNDYKLLISDIDYVQNVRNLMAHSDIIINEKSLENFKKNQLTFKNLTHKNWERDILINIGESFVEFREGRVFSVNEFVKTSYRIGEIIKI